MHFAITNYTDGERAAAIPTAKGTESDVMVFATEDEQEALTQTDVVSLVRDNDGGGGGLNQARGRCVSFYGVANSLFTFLRGESTLRCMYFVHCDTSVFSCPFNLLILCHQGN